MFYSQSIRIYIYIYIRICMYICIYTLSSPSDGNLMKDLHNSRCDGVEGFGDEAHEVVLRLLVCEVETQLVQRGLQHLVYRGPLRNVLYSVA